MKRESEYMDLLNYYKECFSLIDCIHFNSEVSKSVYERTLGECEGKTVSITHGGIEDNRKIKSFSECGLVVGFIGNDTPYKGLQVLKKAIEGLDIEVMVWGGKRKEEHPVHYRGKFSKDQLSKVYKDMDVLVVPSVWKETFSLVTLEALSFGVPVIVSDNVGAQDIVKEYNPCFVYHSEEDLRDLLITLVNDKSQLVEYNKSILKKPWKHDMKHHASEIINLIYL